MLADSFDRRTVADHQRRRRLGRHPRAHRHGGRRPRRLRRPRAGLAALRADHHQRGRGDDHAWRPARSIYPAAAAAAPDRPGERAQRDRVRAAADHRSRAGRRAGRDRRVRVDLRRRRDAVRRRRSSASFTLPQAARRARRGRGPGWRSLREGLAYLRRAPNIRAGFLVDLLAMGFGRPQVLFPAVGALVIGGGPITVGILTASAAIGTFLTGLFSGPVGHVRWQGRAIGVSVMFYGGFVAAVRRGRRAAMQTGGSARSARTSRRSTRSPSCSPAIALAGTGGVRRGERDLPLDDDAGRRPPTRCAAGSRASSPSWSPAGPRIGDLYMGILATRGRAVVPAAARRARDRRRGRRHRARPRRAPRLRRADAPPRSDHAAGSEAFPWHPDVGCAHDTGRRRVGAARRWRASPRSPSGSAPPNWPPRCVAPSASPLFVVGSLVIDLAPPWAKETAIALFGTGDKAALLTGIGHRPRRHRRGGGRAAGAAAARSAGILIARRRASSASVPRSPGPGAAVLDAVPSAVAAIVAVDRARASCCARRPRRAPSTAPTPEPATPTPPRLPRLGRRRHRRSALLATGAGGSARGRSPRRDRRARGVHAAETRRDGGARSPRAPSSASPASRPWSRRTREFYRIDTALQIPRIDPSTWSLKITGMVEKRGRAHLGRAASRCRWRRATRP